MRRLAFALTLTLVFGACGSGDEGGDGGPMLDAAALCTGDDGCSDGLFCNGPERCTPGAPEADARGCAPGVAPCASCDEPTDSCVTECVDEDGDGAEDDACGGDDCDDADPSAYPGNTEVCDAEGHDEDCNPSTVGSTDADGDGRIDDACCNGAVCGGDCDDTNAAIGEGFSDGPPDGCDDLDNDCDGTLDPGCSCTGSETRPCGTEEGVCAFGVQVCTGGRWGDCEGAVEPVAETCDGLDDDCDGSPDDDFACVRDAVRSCTTTCGLAGTEQCRGDCSGFAACVSADESSGDLAFCNGCDDDRDGLIDDGFACIRGATVTCTNTCGRTGSFTCGDDCTPGACRATEACNYCDDDASGGFVADEQPFATGTVAIDGFCNGPMATPPEFEGDTVCDAVSVTGGVGLHARLVSGAGVGGYWYLRDGNLGYGALDMTVRVRVRRTADVEPDGAWAIFIGEPGGSLGTQARAGVPTDRRGLSIEWWHRADVAVRLPPATDRIRVRRWPAGTYLGVDFGVAEIPTPPASQQLGTDDPVGTWVDQDMRVRYTPDDPISLPNEERLQLFIGGSMILDWGFDTMPADDFRYLLGELQVAQRLSILVSAGGGANPGEIELRLEEQLGSPFGGMLTYVHPSSISLEDTCP